jgi:hypothetical protein
MSMEESACSGVRIRHIDARYYFPREKFFKTLFLKTDNNDSDTFAKNGNKESCERHAVKICLRPF